MNNFLLVVHAIAAILFLGPVTVAVSTFHTRALAAHEGDATAAGAAKLLHKITRTYGLLSLAVPLLGIGLLIASPVYLHEGRFHVSILLSVIAWALLFFVIIPKQKILVQDLGLTDPADGPAPAAPGKEVDWPKMKKQLSMFGGIFSLLWVVTAVLMVI